MSFFLNILFIQMLYMNKTLNLMFGLFKKDPAKQLREQYAKLLEEARDLQPQRQPVCRLGDDCQGKRADARARQRRVAHSSLR